MVTRTDQLLRKAMRGYLEHLGNMPLAERITNAAVFEDVYRFLLNGSGRLELRLASAVLDHCHRTGRVRAVVHRSANAAEGRRYVGRTCGVSATNLRTMIGSYRKQYTDIGVLYP